MQLKLCILKHMQSLIVHNSVILVNNQDIFSKSNSSLYVLQVCSNKFYINTLDSFIIVKKAKYPFSLFSAPFEENNQKLVRNEGINSILCIETEPIKIKTVKNNLLQPYLSSRHLLDDHNILNDTKNRAETTHLNIFFQSQVRVILGPRYMKNTTGNCHFSSH